MKHNNLKFSPLLPADRMRGSISKSFYSGDLILIWVFANVEQFYLRDNQQLKNLQDNEINLKNVNMINVFDIDIIFIAK